MVADVAGCVLGGSQRDEGKVCRAVSGSLGKSGNRIQMKGITHCSFLRGHSAKLPVRVSNTEKTGVLFRLCWRGSGWSFLCFYPRCIDIPIWASH